MHQFKSVQIGWIILLEIFSLHGYSVESRNIGYSDTIVKVKNTPGPQVQKYSFSVIPAAENTFGYEITEQGKIIVRQKTIPSLPGNKGFKTKNDAEKCAGLVILKLSRNIMPPTITPKEIDSLGIQSNSGILQKNH